MTGTLGRPTFRGWFRLLDDRDSTKHVGSVKIHFDGSFEGVSVDGVTDPPCAADVVMNAAGIPPEDGNSVAFASHHIAIYDGRELLGEILTGRTTRATDRYGTELGTFRNQEEARQAIIDAAKAASLGGEA